MKLFSNVLFLTLGLLVGLVGNNTIFAKTEHNILRACTAVIVVNLYVTVVWVEGYVTHVKYEIHKH